MKPETCPSASLPAAPSTSVASAHDPGSDRHPPASDAAASGAIASLPRLVDADLALRTLQLLQGLLEKVVGERESESLRQRSVVRRGYTPRSEAPLSRMAAPSAMPTQLRRRSLHFSCPCCGRETVVIRRQAGARIRCPHCHSAVAAPHPARRWTAHSFERDIESVLRPESFGEAMRPMPPRWMRIVAKEPVLILALAALVPFTVLLVLEVPAAIDKSRGGVPDTLVQSVPAVPGRSRVEGAADRAVAVVERYLASSGVREKSAWVRDAARVGPLMASWASHQPGLIAPAVATEIKAAGLTHYQDPSNPVPVTPVVARLADGSNHTFFVEHGPGRDAIEWESSIGYSEPLNLAAGRGKTAAATARAVWRVEAAPDDYFNRAFADEAALICLKLARADQPNETFWAYAPKDSAVGAALRKIWNEAPNDFVQRLTVTVEAGPASAKTRQVRLTAVHHAGWRTPERGSALVAVAR